ncbi:hypothetical protein V5E97_27015 [Singulisphaera sp. Ch08]|uniref:DUF4239 domain-containing protein n=1 Tax=Singulisphaera sp. Ch08 TaxID=3120278 RepID=A0AAU7CAI9_9BACT
MELDTYFMGFFLVTASAILAIIGLLTVRKLLSTRDLISCHDVGGYLLSVVGTLYAVILGLIVVDSMGSFQQARLTTEQESNSLANVLILAKQLPKPKRDEIQKHALTYIDQVINDEWPNMDEGRHSDKARESAIRLFDVVTDFEPKTEKEKAIYATQLTSLCQFWDSRRTRTVTAAYGVTSLEWLVLFVGGAVTVAFTYFFKLDNLRIQSVMTIMVSTLIALNLFLVLMFGYPFSGDHRVSPDGFRVAGLIIGQENRPSEPASSPYR